MFSVMRHIFWKQLKVCEPQVLAALSLLSLSLSISFTACDIIIKSTHKLLLKSSSIKSLKF